MNKLPPMFAIVRRAARRGALTLASFATLVSLVAMPAAAQSPEVSAVESAPADVAAEMRQHVFAMQRAYGRVQDYTATFYKQERVKGELLPIETIELKFRKPFGVYMRWLSGDFAGREVLFVRGWNDDKIHAHQGSFPDITVNLRPDSSLAMRGNRHPITNVGFGETIRLLVRDARLAEARPQDDVQYVDLGLWDIHGARSRCLEARAPGGKSSPYYAPRAKICFNVTTKMPTRVSIWDDEDNLVEDYAYADVRLNPGLGDADFDPANPDYDF
jgi:outer membrane lipoprotein-sorting protein